MTQAILQFIATALGIIVAGAFLTRCADAIADITKLGKLLVGSILLAGATSLPELMVDISAVRQNMANLAVGDLMGSSLFNLLIVAVVDLSFRSRVAVFSRTYAAHALSASMSLLLTALAGLAILIGQRSDNSWFGLGPGVWMILIAYVMGVRIAYYDQRFAAAKLAAEGSAPEAVPHLKLSTAIIGFCLAAGAIVLIAPFLASAAGVIADESGLGKTFVGTVLVAFCTSLPELVATATAIRMGSADLALGNIFGSNAFNMMLLVPLDLICPGSLMAQVSPAHAATAFATIVITAVAVIGQLYNIEKRILLLEPDAFLMTLLIIGALYLIFLLSREEEAGKASMVQPQRHPAFCQQLFGDRSKEKLSPCRLSIGTHHQQSSMLLKAEIT